MNVSIRHISLIAIILITIAHTQAQSLTEYYKTAHGSIDGCIEYDGWLDGVFELDMIICNDTLGAYKMKSSSDIYSIYVEEKDGTIELTEVDTDQRVSGYITLSPDQYGYSGQWRHIESASSYVFEINEKGKVSIESDVYLTKLSGVVRSRLVYITIDYGSETIEIQERFGLQNRYKSNYQCINENCSKISIKPEGIIGVNTVEIFKDKKGKYKMLVLTSDQNRESTELEVIAQVSKTNKAYSDYRSMLLAEYASFGDKDLDEYMNKLQADWIIKASNELRELHQDDPNEIVADRLQHQASSWIDVELWTDDIISGVQYMQYNWKPEVEVESFLFHIDKSRPITLDDVWEDNWKIDQLKKMNATNSNTWVVGREGLHNIHFDRISGVQRESYTYAELKENIDRGSWLDKLLDRDKIKD